MLLRLTHIYRYTGASRHENILGVMCKICPATISLNSIRAKRGPHWPSVFSKREVAKLLADIDGTPGLILRLIYTHVMRSLASSAVSPLDALARAG
jgi:hypothetical protein